MVLKAVKRALAHQKMLRTLPLETYSEPMTFQVQLMTFKFFVSSCEDFSRKKLELEETRVFFRLAMVLSNL